MLTILGSCGNKKTNIDPFASITQEVDSIRHKADSIHQEELPEEPKPTEADESFDDFIYNFASDDALQRQRVKFPLPYYKGDEKPISKNATGSMMTYLPNSIIIRSCLIKKKTWIWWGHLTDLRSGGMDIRENPNGEKVLF